MAIFKSFEFDGENSLDYGVYITGEAVYNAPERVVDMVTVPGRNGALAIDQGRFENIEVTYRAGVFADNQEDFAEKIRTFRNLLASRYSYKRLTDEYNTDEYRLALYKSGLEASPVAYHHAAEFDITFECKPQRFLTDGETAIDIYEEDVLTDHNLEAITDENGEDIEVNYMVGSFENPTLFSSAPLIVVPAAGTVTLNGAVITITSGTFPVYIDCDTMEIYTKSGSTITSASDRVSLNPNKFPTLAAGTVTLASTIDNILIYPRWWRI